MAGEEVGTLHMPPWYTGSHTIPVYMASIPPWVHLALTINVLITSNSAGVRVKVRGAPEGKYPWVGGSLLVQDPKGVMVGMFSSLGGSALCGEKG